MLEDVRTFTGSVTMPSDLMKRFGLGSTKAEEMVKRIRSYYLSDE